MGPEKMPSRPLKKAPDGFLLGSGAAKRLGISESYLYVLVRKGLIPKETPRTGVEGYFSTALIEALIPLFEQRKAKLLSAVELRRDIRLTVGRMVPQKPLALTDWITFEDLPFVQQLDLALYGVEDTVEMAITWQWWQANPHMCRVLFNAENRQDIWGVLTAMPMREATIYKLLRQEMAERDITPDDILTYQPGHAYSCYVPSLAIFPERRGHLRLLLQSFFTFWCELAPDITIERLFAFATSKQGMSVIHHLWFSPRYDLSKNSKDAFERGPFELVPLRPGNPSKLVESFQNCIAKKIQACE